jgi:predicted DNA-binding WGR domain protein
MVASVLIRKVDPARRMARLCRLRLQPRRWGGVSLLQEWGAIGSDGRLRADAPGNADAAEQAGEHLAAAKRRQDYR